MRVRLSTIRISRNFDIDDLRSGHFCDPPHAKSMGKFSNLSNLRESGPVYPERSFHRLLMLITVQLLTIYLPEVMMTSSEVTDAFLSITHDWVKIKT